MKLFSLSFVLLMNLLFMTKQSSANLPDSKIEPELLEQLQNEGRATMIVQLTDSQTNVMDFLRKGPAARGVTFKSLPRIDFIIVRKGDLQLAKDLAKFREISRISPDVVVATTETMASAFR